MARAYGAGSINLVRDLKRFGSHASGACLALAQTTRRNGATSNLSRPGNRELGQWPSTFGDERSGQGLAVLSTSTCRCELRMLIMKPANTSTMAMTSIRKNVDVPAALTRRNSTSMATNKSIDRT
jgi:hypothetical protein